MLLTLPPFPDEPPAAITPALRDYLNELGFYISALVESLRTHTYDASDITTGTLADARLPAEVPLTDENNTFSGNQTFNGNLLHGGAGQLGFFGVAAVGQQGPLTAVDPATVDSVYGAEEAGVIDNNRTRIDEIETALQNLGLLS